MDPSFVLSSCAQRFESLNRTFQFSSEFQVKRRMKLTWEVVSWLLAGKNPKFIYNEVWTELKEAPMYQRHISIELDMWKLTTTVKNNYKTGNLNITKYGKLNGTKYRNIYRGWYLCTTSGYRRYQALKSPQTWMRFLFMEQATTPHFLSTISIPLPFLDRC